MRLPSFRGPYKVGLSQLVRGVDTKTFGKGRLSNGQPALPMQEVAFDVYYPADISAVRRKKYGSPWTQRPVTATLRGYSIFTKIPYWIMLPIAYIWAALLKIPVYRVAPLLDPSETSEKSSTSTGQAEEKPKKRWPLVIFSHGLAGTRTSYSQICGNLASQGYVVLVIGHGDGTAPMVSVPWLDLGKSSRKYYMRTEHVTWLDGEKPRDQLPLRVDQLAYRKEEIYCAYKAFCGLVETGGLGGRLYDQYIETCSAGCDWKLWKDRVQCDEDVVFMGHSFGACTGLSILSNPPPDGHSSIPFSKVMLLDPWLDPLPIPGPMPTPNLNRPPVCIIASEAFTIWDVHFARLKEMRKDWNSSQDVPPRLMTIVRSKHQEFSDFAVLTLPKRTRPMKVLSTTNDTILKFLRGKLEAELEGKARTMVIEEQGKQRYIVGEPGELLVHA